MHFSCMHTANYKLTGEEQFWFQFWAPRGTMYVVCLECLPQDQDGTKLLFLFALRVHVKRCQGCRGRFPRREAGDHCTTWRQHFGGGEWSPSLPVVLSRACHLTGLFFVLDIVGVLLYPG